MKIFLSYFTVDLITPQPQVSTANHHKIHVWAGYFVESGVIARFQRDGRFNRDRISCTKGEPMFQGMLIPWHIGRRNRGVMDDFIEVYKPCLNDLPSLQSSRDFFYDLTVILIASR